MSDLLDTNIISELRKPQPRASVLDYFSSRLPEQLFLSVITTVEIQYGILSAPSLEKRTQFQFWLEHQVLRVFAGRILPITEPILLRWLTLMDQGRKSGRTYSQPDLFLAATALEHNLTLVTRNIKDFAAIPGLKLFNPWTGEPSQP